MTKLHVHELTGLRPDALATYLAALGIIRLLAEQKDASARGFWRDEHFVLVTELDWAEVRQFFLEDYKPTPILAPWNLESGFFSLKPPNDRLGMDDAPATYGDDEAIDDAVTSKPEHDDGDEQEDDAERAIGDPMLDAFSGSSALRLDPFRRAIEIAKAAIPKEVLRAEEDARSAHAETRARVDAERSAYESAARQLEETASAIAQWKAEEELKKSAAKGTAKSSSAREEVAQAQRDQQGQPDDPRGGCYMHRPFAPAYVHEDNYHERSLERSDGEIAHQVERAQGKQRASRG